MHPLLKRFFSVLLFLGCCLPLGALETTGPQVVKLGIYPMNIQNIESENQQFKSDFYLYYTYQNPDYKPLDSNVVIDSPNYEYKNVNTSHAGQNYVTSAHYYADIDHDWSSDNFPFDKENLVISVESDSINSEYQIEPDRLLSGLNPNFHLTRWTLLGTSLEKKVIDYSQNLSKTVRPDEKYDRISFTIQLKRQGWSYFFQYFLGFFVATLLALLGLCILDDIQAQSGFSLAALFMYIGTDYVLSAVLPPLHQFYLVNCIKFGTLFAIIISMIQIIINHLFQLPMKKVARNNMILGTCLMTGYLLLVISITYHAVHQ